MKCTVCSRPASYGTRCGYHRFATDDDPGFNVGKGRYPERSAVRPRPLRAALIRLLWRSAADDDACDCDGGDRTDICDAMRALKWGEHWNRETFEKLATEKST